MKDKLELSARIVDRNERHVRIRVFQNGASSGTLTIDAQYGEHVVWFFAHGLDRIEQLKGELVEAQT